MIDRMEEVPTKDGTMAKTPDDRRWRIPPR
jgi:hypothetical protein